MSIEQLDDRPDAALGLAHWPADRIGKPAIIEGTIERTDQFAAHPSDGLASQGTSGSIFAIRRCTTQ